MRKRPLRICVEWPLRFLIVYNGAMQPTPTSSFFRFTVGFLTFISISFGLTYAVHTYTVIQERTQQAAAIRAAMLGID